MRRHKVIGAVAMLVLATLPVSAASAASCSLSMQDVAFGDYDVFLGSPTSGVGSVTINCDVAVPYTITLSPGQGTYSQRRMTGPSILQYNLYTSASYASIWGDGSGGSAMVSANAAAANHVIYGRIPAEQNVRAGDYSDIMIVTVTY